MSRRLRWVLGCAAVSMCLLAPSVAQAAPSWHDGVAQYAYAINCPSQIFGNPYIEADAAGWAGAYVDANNLPEAGQVFYIRIAAAGIGNPCAGMFANFELILHPDMRLAVSQEFPVLCSSLRAGANQWTPEPACPQQPGQGRFGMTFNPSQGAWPLPTGSMWQVQIPVYSRKRLVGASGSALFCGDCVVTPIQIIDGNDSPYLAPYQWINTNDAQPGASFPSPFATFDTAARTATTTAYEYNYFIAGDAVALLTEDINNNGQRDPNEQPVGQTAFAATTQNDYAVQLRHTWSNLKPNTRYLYELGFFPGGFAPGKTALVSDPQGFVTPNWAAPGGGVGVTGGGSGTQTPPSGGQAPPSQPPPPSDRATQYNIDGLRQGARPNRVVSSGPSTSLAAGVDTVKPTGKLRVARSQKVRALLRGLKVRLGCSETATATATLSVDSRTAKALKLKRNNGNKRKPVTVATGKASCALGRSAYVTVRPSRAIAKRLSKARKPWKATLAVALVDAARNTGLVSAKLTFKR